MRSFRGSRFLFPIVRVSPVVVPLQKSASTRSASKLVAIYDLVKIAMVQRVLFLENYDMLSEILKLYLVNLEPYWKIEGEANMKITIDVKFQGF